MSLFSFSKSAAKRTKCRGEFTFGCVEDSFNINESFNDVSIQNEGIVKHPSEFFSLVKITPFKKSQSFCNDLIKIKSCSRLVYQSKEILPMSARNACHIRKYNSEKNVKEV